MTSVSDLTATDILRCPVWMFDNNSELPDKVIECKLPLPISDASDALFGSFVTFANGLRYLSLIGNFSTISKVYNIHFLTLSVLRDLEWIHLPRYHDIDHHENSESVFASKFALSVESVFPIAYDLANLVLGADDVVRGEISAHPPRLSRRELIAMALEE